MTMKQSKSSSGMRFSLWGIKPTLMNSPYLIKVIFLNRLISLISSMRMVCDTFESLNMVRFSLALVFLCWNRYIKFMYADRYQWLDLYSKADHIGCRGMFINKQNQVVQFDEKTFASLDDTCGFCDLKRLGSGFHVISGMSKGDVLV